MSQYEQIQFDGRTVCVLSPEDVEALELGIQKRAKEIERLKAEIVAIELISDERWFQNNKLRDSIEALRTKFNGLVGELKQLVPVITYDKYGEYGESSEWYSLTAVQSILTKYTTE